MNTSFPPVNLRTDRTAAANAAKRASITKADAEKEAQFQDLLSDRKTHESSPTDDQTRLSAMRHTAAERENKPAATAAVISVQQAMLTVPARQDQEVKKVEEGEPGGPVAPDVDSGQGAGGETSFVADPTPVDPHSPPPAIDDGGSVRATPAGTVKPSLIRPHGPPPVIDDGGDDEEFPTAGIKAPYTDPQDLTVPGVVDATFTGGIKPSPIAPHGPPPVVTGNQPPAPATPTSLQDKPLVIRPHGPVEPTPTTPTDVRSAAAEKLAATFQTDPVSSTGPSNVSPDARVATTPTPAAGITTTGFTTTVPLRPDDRADPVAANPPPTVAHALLVTSAAQAHLAASLAVDAPANPVSVAAANLLNPEAANLAASLGQTQTKGAASTREESSQTFDYEHLATNNISNGTAAAKRQENVIAYPSNLETATEHAPGSSPDADRFGASGSTDGWSSDSLRGRAMDGDAARASAAPAFTLNPGNVAVQTPFVVPTANAAPSTGIVQVDRMETLLQTVQQTAQQVRFDGTRQVELRVRLAGVADDVTVRVHLDGNQQAQVSFQTGSPELRAALEQGWNDLTSTVSTATEAPAASLPDVPTANPADAYREDRRMQTASAAPEQAARRWSGYA